MPYQTTCTRRLEWDAAHRVLKHEGKCRHLHGHRYAAEITCRGRYENGLDQLGRVVDFGVIKEAVGGWIDSNWDHNIILHPDDPLVAVWRHPHVLIQHGVPVNNDVTVRGQDVFGEKEPFILDPEHIGRYGAERSNPTAENLACYLFYKAGYLLQQHNIEVTNVRVWETPNSFADYGLSSQKED